MRPNPHTINFQWLIRLRWAAIAGQLVTIATVLWVMHAHMSLRPLLVIVGASAALNVACTVWTRRGGAVGAPLIAAVMALDIALFTGLLYFTGGPFNPFSFLYLVYLSLAAIVLPARWTWGLAALSLACSGVLFVDHHEVHMPHHGDHMAIHLRGMWVALGVAAVFIVYFVMRVRTALAEREAELERASRLGSLATLAAGAAHELATPLSTIAMVANELRRRPDSGETRDDVELIRSEVARCREILDRMSDEAGERAGEGLTDTSVGALMELALQELRDAPAVELVVDGDGAADAALTVPARALAQAIRGVVRNAQDASPADRPVTVTAAIAGDTLRVEITDHGAGMAPDVLARAGEPFFTTKEPGRGMGLGLFVARATVDELRGELTLSSKPGAGTTAVITVPRSARATNRRMVRSA